MVFASARKWVHVMCLPRNALELKRRRQEGSERQNISNFRHARRRWYAALRMGWWSVCLARVETPRWWCAARRARAKQLCCTGWALAVGQEPTRTTTGVRARASTRSHTHTHTHSRVLLALLELDAHFASRFGVLQAETSSEHGVERRADGMAQRVYRCVGKIRLSALR